MNIVYNILYVVEMVAVKHDHVMEFCSITERQVLTDFIQIQMKVC